VRYVEDEAEAQKYWREMNSSVKQTHVALDGHRVALVCFHQHGYQLLTILPTYFKKFTFNKKTSISSITYVDSVSKNFYGKMEFFWKLHLQV